MKSLDIVPDEGSVGASTASANDTSESITQTETEQDAFSEADDGLGDFDAGGFDPES